MFKEDYKKHFDDIHPSSELIEKTKRLAMEQMNEEDTEDVDKLEDDFFISDRKIRWYQIGGAVAAVLTFSVMGAWIGNVLQSGNTQKVDFASNYTTPFLQDEETLSPVSSESGEKNKDTNKKSTDKTHNGSSEANKAYLDEHGMSEIAKLPRASEWVLDYADTKMVVMHNINGIIVYSFEKNGIILYLDKDNYMYPNAWNLEIVSVRSDYKKLQWKSSLSASTSVYTYDFETGKVVKDDTVTEGEVYHSSVNNLLYAGGADGDIYTKESWATKRKVSIGQGVYCQLFYQVPKSDICASLTLSFVDTVNKTEKLYNVFGSVGESLEKKNGNHYGGYHNELGMQWFNEKNDEGNDSNADKNENTDLTEGKNGSDVSEQPTEETEEDREETEDEKETETEEEVVSEEEIVVE